MPWLRYPIRSVLPRFTLPRIRPQVTGEQPQQRGLPEPFTPIRPIRMPGPIDQERSRSSIRSPSDTLTLSRSKTSLPNRAVANRCSCSRSRGAGSSATGAAAASRRNFGFEVQAGGPRRSQASSFRSRLFRRAAAVAALRRAQPLRARRLRTRRRRRGLRRHAPPRSGCRWRPGTSGRG